MVRNDARYYLVMLISEFNHSKANAFEALFHHREKQRSSDRAEMQEINEFFGRALRPFNKVGADVALNLTVDRGIDVWLQEIRKDLITYIIKDWRP